MSDSVPDIARYLLSPFAMGLAGSLVGLILTYSIRLIRLRDRMLTAIFQPSAKLLVQAEELVDEMSVLAAQIFSEIGNSVSTGSLNREEDRARIDMALSKSNTVRQLISKQLGIFFAAYIFTTRQDRPAMKQAISTAIRITAKLRRFELLLRNHME